MLTTVLGDLIVYRNNFSTTIQKVTYSTKFLWLTKGDFSPCPSPCCVSVWKRDILFEWYKNVILRLIRSLLISVYSCDFMYIIALSLCWWDKAIFKLTFIIIIIIIMKGKLIAQKPEAHILSGSIPVWRCVLTSYPHLLNGYLTYRGVGTEGSYDGNQFLTSSLFIQYLKTNLFTEQATTIPPKPKTIFISSHPTFKQV